MWLLGGSSLDGAVGLPLDLASSFAFALNDTFGLWVGGLGPFRILWGSSPTLRSTIFPFPFTGAHTRDGCPTTSLK